MEIYHAARVVALSCLAGAMLASLPARADEDADKLKQLEHAMTPSGDKTLVRKPHTRAIVFDAPADAGQAQAQKPVQAQAQNAAVQAQTQAAAPVKCSAPAADAKYTAVDFAIQFRSGSAELTESAEQTLQKIASILSISNNCILVEGHTDSIGNADRNLELSRQRAGSVVKFITGNAGVDPARLIPVGKGSSEPLKDLDSRNPKNRRVVFKVVG